MINNSFVNVKQVKQLKKMNKNEQNKCWLKTQVI